MLFDRRWFCWRSLCTQFQLIKADRMEFNEFFYAVLLYVLTELHILQPNWMEQINDAKQKKKTPQLYDFELKKKTKTNMNRVKRC